MTPRCDSPQWPRSPETGGNWVWVVQPRADGKHHLWAWTPQKGAASLTPDFSGVSEFLTGAMNRGGKGHDIRRAGTTQQRRGGGQQMNHSVYSQAEEKREIEFGIKEKFQKISNNIKLKPAKIKSSISWGSICAQREAGAQGSRGLTRRAVQG